MPIRLLEKTKDYKGQLQKLSKTSKTTITGGFLARSTAETARETADALRQNKTRNSESAEGSPWRKSELEGKKIWK